MSGSVTSDTGLGTEGNRKTKNQRRYGIRDGVNVYELRDYQQECIDSIRAAVRSQWRRMLVVLPTGTGKTHIFCQFAKSVRGRMLVIAHREELINQTRDTVQREAPGRSVGIEKAGQRAGDADIVVASIQTLSASNNNRLHKLDPASFSLVVIDEAHHSVASTYLSVLDCFGLVPPGFNGLSRKQRVAQSRAYEIPASAPYLLGFTATPFRHDKIGLRYAFDTITYSKHIREMIHSDWLCDVRGEKIRDVADISSVATRGADGDYVEKDLADVVNTPERNELITESYTRLATGRPALCFGVTVQHSRALAINLREYGVTVGEVYGHTPKAEREQLVNAYQCGELDVLCGCMVFTEGFDSPITSCLIMARPTKSMGLYAQMVGRGLRPSPGKRDCLVIDLVGNTEKMGVPSLFRLLGLPPSVPMDKGIDEAEHQLQVQRSNGELFTAGESDPLTMGQCEYPTELEWQVVNADHYGIDVDGKSFDITVNPLGQAMATATSGNQTRFVDKDGDPEQLFERVDELLHRHYPDACSTYLRKGWRDNASRHPATIAQRRRIERLGGQCPDAINRLQAHDMINSLQRHLATT